MTRDEALERVRPACVGSPVSAFVDMAAALGLLTLDEPKGAIDEVCADLGWGEYNKIHLQFILDKNNLKLVRA